MLKKKKTTASGKLVLVKSVRRTHSHRMKFCVQRGLGALPRASKAEGKSRQDFSLCGPSVLTPALLAPFASLHGCMRCCSLSVRYFFSISSCKSRLTWV